MFTNLFDFENNWFARQLIVRKLQIGFAAVLGLALIVCIAVSLAMVRLSEDLSHAANTVESANRVGQLSSVIAKGQLHTEAFIGLGDAEQLRQAQVDFATASTLLNGINKVVGEGEDERGQMLKTLKADFTKYAEAIGALEKSIDLNDATVLNYSTALGQVQDIKREGQKIIALSGQLSKSLLSEANAVQNSEASFVRTMVIVTMALSLFTLLLGFFLAQKIGLALARPFERITTAMQALAGGDRSVVVPHTDRVDEVGGMARSLDVFKANAIEMEQLRAISEESSRLQIERQAEQLMKQQLLIENAKQFEATVSKVVSDVASASSQLQSTALAMSSAADQTSQQTLDVSNALNEASAGVTAAAAASDEFAMSVSEISKQASASAELARIAVASANQTDETITEMQAAAAQVGQIVELIQSIAQRTNLLALNASIEAARNGEAGRGFAVVAAEVKDLASQTSKATDEVAQQIQAIQDTTGASALALRAIAEQVSRLETTSVAIASAVDQQSISGVDLARSIDLAARSTDSVASNIVSVRETALATGTAASQVLTSSNDLESQAGVLREQVESFLSQIRAA